MHSGTVGTRNQRRRGETDEVKRLPCRGQETPQCAEGGYEATFGRWCVLAPGSEPLLRREASALLDELHTAEATVAEITNVEGA